MNGGEGDGEDPSLPDGEREEEEVSNKAAARLAARTRTQMGKREVEGRTREVASGKTDPLRNGREYTGKGYLSEISGRAQHSFMASTG